MQSFGSLLLGLGVTSLPFVHAAVSPTGQVAVRVLEAIGWVRVPAGSFEMGCIPSDEDCRPNEQPQHRVTLSRPYDLMSTEVTFEQFRTFTDATGRVMPRQPSWNRADDRPVVNVTWEEIDAFCAWVGGRLPTEAEWERAARAGEEGLIYSWGAQFDPAQVNGQGHGEHDAWRWTAPVGAYPPNAFGLHDMLGNVWEWVSDRYWIRQYANSRTQNPVGPAAGRDRVLRGGSWDSERASLRLSFRFHLPPEGRYGLYVGGRCARAAP